MYRYVYTVYTRTFSLGLFRLCIYINVHSCELVQVTSLNSEKVQFPIFPNNLPPKALTIQERFLYIHIVVFLHK